MNDDRLVPALEELVESLRSTPATRQSRSEVLHRLSTLLQGEDGALLVCARVNEHALRGLPTAAVVLHHLDDITQLLAPEPDVTGRMRGRLAVSALVMAAAHGPQLGGTTDERSQAALALAHELLQNT